PGHADDDVVGGKSVRSKSCVECSQEIRQIALALRKRESAGRQRDARQRISSQAGPGREQPGPSRDPMDLVLLVGWNIGNDQVLVRRNTEVAIVRLRDSSQRALPSGARRVVNATVLHEQRQMTVSTVTLRPAIVIAGRRKGEGLRRRKFHAS